MKRRATAWVLAICCALTGCAKGDEISAESEPPKVPAELKYHTELDYSDHTAPNEAAYRTVLADPAELLEGEPVLTLREPAPDWVLEPFTDFSVKEESWGYDVRRKDLSQADLSEVGDWNGLSFDTNTVWPEQLPQGFDPGKILEFNKNPGLGIRALHERGITGEGVGIAILDQPLLPDHEQYRDNLMYYERIHCGGDSAAMHGSAVASIAVGKDIGVAPGAKLYYIAETHGHTTEEGYEFDASIIADSIMRVLEINQYLPENEKIRVISISRGVMPGDKGFEALKNAVIQAGREDIFVITTRPNWNYSGFFLAGMSRDYGANPDYFDSYGPEGWNAEDYYADPAQYENCIRVPTGSGTYAGCTGPSDYEVNYEGGMSWGVPWLAGFYALCCQVNPDITFVEFLEVVDATAATNEITKDGQAYPFGKILNPAAVIDELTARTTS